MQRFLKLLTLLLVVTLVITSCKDEKEEAPSVGLIVFDGQTYDIMDGAVFPDQDGELTEDETLIYQHDVILSGKKEFSISFSLIGDGTTLEAGTYTFATHDWLYQYSPGDFHSIYAWDGETQFENFTEGTVVVEKTSDDKYSFTVNAVIDGKETTAEFSGKVQIVLPE